MNYFSPEQQYNAWIISDLLKQIFSKEDRQDANTHLFETFAAQQFGINIDFVFSIIMNIGDTEMQTANSTEDILASYLFSLLPFVTKDMINDSKENANQYLLNTKDADVYHLFLPESVLRETLNL
ncbi:DUF3212 family protein [Bacillus sonorensis]|uniref:DUF3212 domain-containing protein n=2 Tax=Bacillus sonorensis TaxID=119858 RepID=M5P807_9BACI|nr:MULTISPECIES: DUF3212 family protein [Bacillus]TWK74557.1 hypothetical protein CHCC20335_2971 [Bacillus paralicheniformis]ASB87528.1 uncharacterized protein S101395_00974 [Bacillus sonorensis]EME75559.1 hypothetical protein BSONL12_06998 [Bacillus sonorensis L12]MBG9913914.1 hypothetical protein [Bacillus sonorensis]MCF7616984.1 DUF3212 family protein [Bacillus sonorensis]